MSILVKGKTLCNLCALITGVDCFVREHGWKVTVELYLSVSSSGIVRSKQAVRTVNTSTYIRYSHT